MAITAGQWHTITIKGFADSLWNTATIYTLPPQITSAIRGSSNILVYCEDDAGPYKFHFDGGSFQLHTTLLNSESAETIDTTVLDSDGDQWTSVRDGSGGWLFFDAQLGIVRRLATPGTLSAFLA
jgi:hypothetical protein